MQQRRLSPVPRQYQWTAKTGLRAMAWVFLVGSAIYWWRIQSAMTPDWIVAGVMAGIATLGPPATTSFLIPWTPTGMLFQRIQSKTYGYMAVAFAAAFLLLYSFVTGWDWWAVQPITLVDGTITSWGEMGATGVILRQVIVSLIGFILIPALMWAPVTDEEVLETIRQDHLVRRYELQVQADVAILRATLLRAQEKALIGFANLAVKEREELAGVMRGLVAGIAKTHRQIAESVRVVSGAVASFDTLDDSEDIQGFLTYIEDGLVNSETNTALARAQQSAPEPRPVVLADPEPDPPPLAARRPVAIRRGPRG